MIVEIEGKSIKISSADVKLAKRLVRDFVDTVDDKAAKRGATFFKYPLMCVMYLMSKDYIESCTPEVLQILMGKYSEQQSVNSKKSR